MRKQNNFNFQKLFGSPPVSSRKALTSWSPCTRRTTATLASCAASGADTAKLPCTLKPNLKMELNDEKLS